MSKEFTFIYFGLNARGDAIRMMLAHAGVVFEDKRVDFAQWPAMKPTMPGG